MRSADRIHQLLAHHADHRPDAVALLDDTGASMSYADWMQASTQAAGDLRAMGVDAGHRLLIVAENCLALPVLLMAASLLDAWSVPVNARLSAAELEHISNHARPAATVFLTAVSRAANGHAARHSTAGLDVSGQHVEIMPAKGTAPEVPVHERADQVATLLYTTGTTGEPKGVMLTHANLIYGGTTSAEHRGIDAHDHVYGVLPLTHVFGLSSAFMAALSAGATLQLVAGFDAARTLDALANTVSVFPAVPQMYARLMAHAAEHGHTRLDARRLKYISSGGAPLDLAWKTRVEAFFALPLFNGYGMTEATAGIAATRPGATREDTSVGRMLPGQQIRIDAAGDANEPGEILIRGPNIMKGYYRNPRATAEVLSHDGWLRTGDLGYLDEDSNLHIVGRTKELIVRSGFNVYPLEVEAALNTHPEVVQAAVIGWWQDGNEEIVAFIHRHAGSRIGHRSLKRHLQDRLAPYKHPTRWIFSRNLPAAPSGKILKARLADRFRHQLEATSTA